MAKKSPWKDPNINPEPVSPLLGGYDAIIKTAPPETLGRKISNFFEPVREFLTGMTAKERMAAKGGFLPTTNLRPVFGKEALPVGPATEYRKTGMIPINMASRMLEAIPKFALQLFQNMKDWNGTAPDLKIPFDAKRLGFDTPEIKSSGKRFQEAFDRINTQNPPKTNMDAWKNFAYAHFETTIPDVMDAIVAGSMVKMTAKSILKLTKYDPLIERSLSELGLTEKFTKQEFHDAWYRSIKEAPTLTERVNAFNSGWNIYQKLTGEGTINIVAIDGKTTLNPLVKSLQNTAKNLMLPIDQWGMGFKVRPIVSSGIGLPGYQTKPSFGLNLNPIVGGAEEGGGELNRKIQDLIIKGLTPEQIAKKLDVTIETVKGIAGEAIISGLKTPPIHEVTPSEGYFKEEPPMSLEESKAREEITRGEIQGFIDAGWNSFDIAKKFNISTSDLKKMMGDKINIPKGENYIKDESLSDVWKWDAVEEKMVRKKIQPEWIPPEKPGGLSEFEAERLMKLQDQKIYRKNVNKWLQDVFIWDPVNRKRLNIPYQTSWGRPVDRIHRFDYKGLTFIITRVANGKPVEIGSPGGLFKTYELFTGMPIDIGGQVTVNGAIMAAKIAIDKVGMRQLGINLAENAGNRPTEQPRPVPEEEPDIPHSIRTEAQNYNTVEEFKEAFKNGEVQNKISLFALNNTTLTSAQIKSRIKKELNYYTKIMGTEDRALEVIYKEKFVDGWIQEMNERQRLETKAPPDWEVRGFVNNMIKLGPSWWGPENFLSALKNNFPEITGEQISNAINQFMPHKIKGWVPGGKGTFGRPEKIKKPYVRDTATPYNTVGVRGLNRVGMAPEPVKMITKPEDVLLRIRMRAMERGSRIGFKAGYIEARDALIEKFKTKKIAEKEAKKMILDYANTYLPKSARGGLLRTVADAKTLQNVILALIRIDNLAQKILFNQSINDLKNTLKEISKSKNIDIVYVNRIKKIINNIELNRHNPQTIKELTETMKYLEREKAAGNEVELPERILEKLQILSRVSRNDLTQEQIDGIIDEIELLKTIGKTGLKARNALYNYEKEKITQDILKSAIKFSSKEVQGIPLEGKLSAQARAVNFYHRAFNELQSKVKFGIKPMGGIADITGVPYIKNRLDLDKANYLNHPLKTNILDDVNAIIKKNKLTASNMKRIRIYEVAQQVGGYEKLANVGISKDVADSIVLTPGEMEYHTLTRKHYDEWYPAVKKFARDNYNVDVGLLPNYVPFITDFSAAEDLNLRDRFGPLSENIMRKNVPMGFTKERVGAGNQIIEIDAHKTFLRHTDNVAYMLTNGKDIKMISEIFNDPRVKDAMGDVANLAWREYMDLSARMGGIDQARKNELADFFRKNLGRAVMPFKIGVSLIQLSSFADTAAVIGAKYTASGANNIALSKEWRKFIWDNFPEIRNTVGDDPSFIELSEGWLGELSRYGFMPLKALDGLVRMSNAAGAYEMLMDKAGLEIDFSKPNKEIVQEAQKLTTEAQSSSFWWNQPLSLTRGRITGNRSLDRLILQFQSFILGRFENFEKRFWREGIKKGDYTRAATAFFWLVIVSSMLGVGLRRISKRIINFATGNKNEEDKFWKDMVLDTTQNIPLMGQVISAIIYGSDPVPVLNAFQTGITGAKGVITGKQPKTRMKGMITLISALTELFVGLPGTAEGTNLIRKLMSGDRGPTTPSNKPMDIYNTGSKPNVQIKKPNVQIKKPIDIYNK